MKALKSKTTSSNLQPQQASKPSFEKDGEATFFSEATNDIQTKPFFSFDNNTTRGYTNNDKPFFSPATIQPKLTIGQPNDKYEQEADAMADEVVQQMEQTDSAPAIQAKCNQCEEEDQLQKKEELEETDKDIQEKPIFDSETEPEVQTKIEPSPVVAPEPVVTPVAPITTINVVESPIQKEEQEKEIEETEGELDLQRKTIFDSEDDPPKEETVMTKSESGQVHATDNLQKQLNSSKGSGSSLPNDTRSNMESSFGADFSSVNIHTGSDAVQMNKGLGAQAFTHGNDIYFNEGKYDTSSSGGKHLLAHELTHTVQQGGGIHKKEDVCETDKKDKTKETAKQKETTPSKEDCPPKKTKPEQPKKGTKKPDEEEKTLPISSKEGASVNDRQSDAPSPLDTAPEVGNANKEDAKDAALDPCDKKPDAKEGGKKKSTEQGDGKLANGDKNTSSKEEKTKDSKKEPQKGDASFLDSLINKGNTGHLVPDGLGEAASPELLAEKETTIQNGNAAREGLVGLHAKVNGLSINDLQFRRPDLAEMNSEEGAQVTAAHNQSSTIANQFVQLNANRLSTFIEGSLLKAELIRKQTQSQKDQIQTTIQEKRLLAKATSQSLIARAKEKATSSIAAVNAKHLNSILKIELETLKSKLKLQKDHQVKVRDLADFRLKQLGSIELSYLKGYQNTLQVGKTYGIKAAMLGRVMGREYEAANGQDENTRIKVTQPKKDGFWDGYLTHNKYMARAKSAREVGKQYQEGMEDQAKKQAEQMLCGKPKDLIALNGTTQWATKQLQCTLDTGLERIEANRTLNLQKAEENRKALFELINKSTQVTIDQLKLMEKTQLQFLTDYGIRQSMAIERDSEKSITALLSGVSEAGNHLWESLMFFNQMVVDNEAPEPLALQQQLNEMSAVFISRIEILEGRSGVASKVSNKEIGNGGEQTLNALEVFITSEIEESITIETTFEQTINKLVANASTSYDTVVVQYAKMTQETVKQTQTIFNSLVTGIKTKIESLNTKREEGFKNTQESLKTGMMNTIKEDLPQKIQCEAEKAAGKVKPWWKKVLKVLAIILIVVAVIVLVVVAGPLMAAAGAWAAGLAGTGAVVAATALKLVAIAVVGGLVGAVTSGLITMGINIYLDKNVWEGVWKAMKIGFVAGAFGGLGGHFAQVILKGGAAGLTIGSKALAYGIEIAFDVVGGVLGDLAFGELTKSGVLWGLGISVGVSGAFGLLSKGFGKIFKNANVNVKVDIDVNAPKTNIDVNAPKTDVDVNAPKVKGDGDKPVAGSGSKQKVDGDSGSPPPKNKTDEGGTPSQGTKQQEVESGTAKTKNKETADLEGGKKAEIKTEDGHLCKVLKDGSIVKCSDCKTLRELYTSLFEQFGDDPAVKALVKRLDDLEIRMNNRISQRANAGIKKRHLRLIKALERDLENIQVENILKAYQKKFPKGYGEYNSREAIRAELALGKAYNIETGNFNPPKVKPPKGEKFDVDKHVPAGNKEEFFLDFDDITKAYKRGDIDRDSWKAFMRKKYSGLTDDEFVEQLAKHLKGGLDDSVIRKIVVGGKLDRFNITRALRNSPDPAKTLRQLSDLDDLARRNINVNEVVGDLAAGGNKFDGANFVLDFIDGKKLWKNIEGFEVRTIDGGRKYDLAANALKYEFKSIEVSSFSGKNWQQMETDIGGILSGRVKWIFNSKKISAEMQTKLIKKISRFAAKSPKFANDRVALNQFINYLKTNGLGFYP